MFEIFSTVNSLYVLVGSMLLGLAGGVLGVFAVLRKQGLLGDALAHSALPGIALAFLIMQTKFLPGLLLGALISGLIGSACIYCLVRFTKVKMDSAMATVLSVFFGIGILLLTYIQKLPLASQSGLDSFLFGQAAALLKSDVYFIAGAFVFVIFIVVLFWKELKLYIFDQDLARVIGFRGIVLEFLFMTTLVVTVLMSLQAVGVILTAAIFITPAVSALLWSDRLFKVVVLSGFFGMIAGGFGATFSAVSLKMPTGPVIVMCLFAIFLASFFFAPKKGIIWRWIKRRKYSIKVKEENMMGVLFRSHEKGTENWTFNDYEHYGFDKSVFRRLKRRGFLTVEDSVFRLSKEGFSAAAKVIEKHRLWETYLVNQLKVDPSFVHRDAETIEHVLTDEMVKELKKILGDPKKDPHGKPIKE
jgi:manganese/zinc/iron transport system permease protein